MTQSRTSIMQEAIDILVHEGQYIEDSLQISRVLAAIFDNTSMIRYKVKGVDKIKASIHGKDILEVKLYFNRHAMHYYFQVKCVDQSEFLFRHIYDEKNHNRLISLMRSVLFYQLLMFAQIDTKSGRPYWHSKSQQDIYADCNNFPDMKTYKRLHQLIIVEILGYINKYPRSQFNIVEGGCGGGMFLSRLHDELQLNNIKVNSLVGFEKYFDVNKASFEDTNAFSRAALMPGDVVEFDQWAAHYMATHYYSPTAKTILVLSGVITRKVIANSYASIHAMQLIAKSPLVDIVIGGGHASVLLSSYICKRLGFKPAMYAARAVDASKHHYFCIEKMKPGEIVAEKQRLLRQHPEILDLQYCPNPAQILQLLNQDPTILAEWLAQDSCILDLSFCCFDDACAQQVQVLLELNPHIKLIFRHYDHELVVLFNSHFIGKYLVIASDLVTDVRKLASTPLTHFAMDERPLMPFSKVEYRLLAKAAPNRNNDLLDLLNAYSSTQNNYIVTFIFKTYLSTVFPGCNVSCNASELLTPMLYEVSKQFTKIAINIDSDDEMLFCRLDGNSNELGNAWRIADNTARKRDIYIQYLQNKAEKISQLLLDDKQSLVDLLLEIFVLIEADVYKVEKNYIGNNYHQDLDIFRDVAKAASKICPALNLDFIEAIIRKLKAFREGELLSPVQIFNKSKRY